MKLSGVTDPTIRYMIREVKNLGSRVMVSAAHELDAHPWLVVELGPKSLISTLPSVVSSDTKGLGVGDSKIGIRKHPGSTVIMPIEWMHIRHSIRTS